MDKTPCVDIKRTAKEKRLIWRCRRGCKELDLILSAFVTTHYRTLPAADQVLFQGMLECPDPQLTDWLCHGAAPEDPSMASIVHRILSTGRG